MSIFDKYNVNPYVTTYAGAPIAEYQQTANALQQRMDQNLAKADQIEIAMKNLEVADIDEDFKNQKIREYQAQLEEIAQSPEYATSKVRALSKQFATDEGLKEAQANKQRIAAIQKEIAEGDYSDFQIRKFNEELAKYQAKDEEGLSGIAAGRRFGSVNFYEERDLNKETLDQVKGILGEKFGDYIRDSEGNLVNSVGDSISENRVRGVAQGMLSNNQVMRQVADEYRSAKGLPSNQDLSTEEHAKGLQEFFNSRYVDPAIAKYSINSEVNKLNQSQYSGLKKRLDALNPAISAPAASVMIGTDLSSDASATVRLEEREQLKANMEEGVFTDYADIIAAENYVNRLDESLKRAMLGTEDNPTDLPEEVKAIVEQATPDQLWDLVRKGPSSGKDGALALLQEFNNFSDFGESYDATWDAREAIAKKVKANYGTDMLKAFNAATHRQTIRNQAIEELRASPEGYSKEALPTKMQEIRVQRVADLTNQVKNDYQSLIANSGFSNIKAYQFLRQGGMSQEQAAEYQRDLEGFIEDTAGAGFARGYNDMMEDGIMEAATNRNTVNSNAVMSDKMLEAVGSAVAQQFNTENIDMSNFEAFTVLTDGYEKKLSTEFGDLEKYDFSELEVTRVDATSGAGFIEVKVPALKPTENQPLTMALNLSTDQFAQARNKIAQAAFDNLTALEKTGGAADQIEIQRAVFANFSAPDILKDIKLGLADNTYGPDKMVAIGDSYVTHAFGEAVYAKYDPDGRIIFRGSTSDRTYTQGADNATLAFAQLMKAAEKQFSTK